MTYSTCTRIDGAFIVDGDRIVASWQRDPRGYVVAFKQTAIRAVVNDYGTLVGVAPVRGL